MTEGEIFIHIRSMLQFGKELRRCSDDPEFTEVITKRQRDGKSTSHVRCIFSVTLSKFGIAPKSAYQGRTLVFWQKLHVLRVRQVFDGLAEIENAIQGELQRATFGADHKVIANRSVASESLADHPIDGQN